MEDSNEDIELLAFINTITDEWEWADDLAVFETFESRGVAVEQVADLLVALRQHRKVEFPVDWEPECIMDCVDIALERPRTLDRLREEAKLCPPMNEFVPLKPTLWQRVKAWLQS